MDAESNTHGGGFCRFALTNFVFHRDANEINKTQKAHTHSTRGVLAVERSAGEFPLRPDGVWMARRVLFFFDGWVDGVGGYIGGNGIDVTSRPPLYTLLYNILIQGSIHNGKREFSLYPNLPWGVDGVEELGISHPAQYIYARLPCSCV